LTDYLKQPCEACSINAPKVTDKELLDFLKLNRDWTLSTDVNYRQLEAIFSFNDFISAQAFSNQVGALAEQEGHHPSILLEYGLVKIKWWSHKIKDLHVNDLIMATKTKNLHEMILKD
jgi:4a-hydroxytetrahydrobiopterin dehydratase